MRFAPKSLVVGSPVPENAADVASGLVVEWRPTQRTTESDAIVGALRLAVHLSTVRENSWWSWGVHGEFNSYATDAKGDSLSGSAKTEDEAKRAAVLALASHIVSRGEPSAGLVDARDRLVDALAKSPAPPAEEVKAIVQGRRPFAVGDVVRLTAEAAALVRQSMRGQRFKVDAVDSVFVRGIGLDDDGQRWSQMPHRIEHAAPSFTWCRSGGFNGSCVNMAEAGIVLYAYDDGDWQLWTADRGAIAGQIKANVGDRTTTTLDEAKAAAEAAYLRATR